MRPTVREFALSIMLLIGGVALAAIGATGIIRDIAAAIPVRWLPSGGGRPSEAVWWLRACLADWPCRQSAAALVASSLARHERALWGGLLVVAASAAWLRHLRLRSLRPRRPGGDARFASRAELRRLTRSRGAWFPLGYARRWPFRRPVRYGAGLASMLATAWAQPVRLPEEDLARHVLVLGLTGAHKTTSVVFPVLVEAARAGVSVVALDLKYGEPDSLAAAAPAWQCRDRDVLVFAPLDPATLRWNPLSRCRTVGDAYQIAAQLFDEPDSSDPELVYWLGAERHLCAVLGLALATDPAPATLGRLRALCESGPAAVQAYLRAHPIAKALLPRLGAYQAMLPKDQAGILEGIVSRLEAWGDETVCAATGPSAPWDAIDLDRVRREPLFLVVGMPQAALGRLRSLCRFFLRDLANCLLRPRGANERVRVLLILEELPAWGALPGLADHLATYRSRQVTVLATAQSEAQGEYVYGRSGWAAIAANLVTKLYLPSLADADADWLSRMLGTAAGEDVARSRGWGGVGTRKGEHRRAIPVPLERPEVLRGVDSCPDQILVRLARMAPARLWCPPYYLRPEYAHNIGSGEVTTAGLAVYHHLRGIRTQGGRRVTSSPSAATDAAGPPAPHQRREAPPHGEPAYVHAGEPAVPEVGEVEAGILTAAAPAGRPVPSQDTPRVGGLSREQVRADCPAADVAALNRLIEALIARGRTDGDGAITGERRGGRIVELRVRSEVVAETIGGTEAMHALARRWSALRWVRRVRPVFVLSRRALDALDPRSLEGLGEWLEDAPAPSGPPASVARRRT